jgi:hypothetical protein
VADCGGQKPTVFSLHPGWDDPLSSVTLHGQVGFAVDYTSMAPASTSVAGSQAGKAAGGER